MTQPDSGPLDFDVPPAAPPEQPARSGLLHDLRQLTPSERGLWRLPLMWAAALAILFIPVIYVAVYLGSVWNPYGQLNKLPVALVVLDTGTVYRGKSYNLGTDLVQKFHENPPVRFVRYGSEAQAQRAVRRGEVYFSLTLPADFSRRAVAGNSAEHGLIRLYSAEGTSYFASRVGVSVAGSLASSLSARLGSTRWDTVQASLTRVQQGFGELRAGTAKLRDGASALAAGTGRLNTGATTLASGAQAAATGSKQLQQGARSLSDGVTRLTSGVTQLSGGVRQLSAQTPGQAQLQPLLSGAAALAKSNAGLASGLGQLAAGTRDLSAGTTTLNAGTVQARQGATRLSEQLPALASGLVQAQAGAQTLATGADALNLGAEQLSAGLDQLSDGAGQPRISPVGSPSGNNSATPGLSTAQLSALQGRAGPLRTGAEGLGSGAARLQSGAQALAQSLGVAQTGAQRAASGAAQLASAAGQLQAGSAKLQSGAEALAVNTAKASTAAGRLSQGATDLNDGLNTLVAGTLKVKAALGTMTNRLPAQADLNTLASGADTLAQKSAELAAGVKRLQTGATQLAAGTADADAGAIRLQTGLNTLYSRIPASVEQLGGDPDGLSTSVQVFAQTTAKTQNNGAAFAPYFIALSLWVGCTLTTFIFPYLLIAESARATGQLARVLRKFAVPAIYVVAQALIVVLGVHLLGVEVLHPGLVLFTAVAASLTFMLLVLALNLLLGAAGRLLALVLLVIQLAASGGSYPVELSSPFFQWLHVYIPVTDAINAMRSAMFGSYEGQYGAFMLRMGLVALVSLLVALLSTRRWHYTPDERFRSPLVLDVG